MSALFFVLLRILFPLDPVARLREVTRDFLCDLIGYIEDPRVREDFETLAEARAWLEAQVITAEHGVHLLIHERARQILGLPFIFTPRIRPPVLYKVKPLREILARFRQVAMLYENLERLAERRAARLRTELEQNPLRLAPTAQSTSPALCAMEAAHRCLASLSPQDWGRWHARSGAHDGGGATARGPPLDLQLQKRQHHALALTCENAPARLPLSNIMKSRSNPPARVAAPSKQA